eukprot:TRINITY_DN12206_c0_g1_i1.p2 TRINITY_DN12206_c0_g1~~TRINITY_DN12206_c0_g1_i1.p2  ORF type:complete len:135 (-),score=22.54 TRINITY_DN12206_c0_g1_i1:203-607(-)
MSEERCRDYKSSKPLFGKASIAACAYSASGLHRKALLDKLREQQILRADLPMQDMGDTEMSQEEVDALYEQYLSLEDFMDTEETCSLCDEGRVKCVEGVLHCSTEGCFNIPFSEGRVPSKRVLREIRVMKEGHA